MKFMFFMPLLEGMFNFAFECITIDWPKLIDNEIFKKTKINKELEINISDECCEMNKPAVFLTISNV